MSFITWNLEPVDFDKGAKNLHEKRKNLQQMMLGKLHIHIQKNVVKPRLIALHKN